MGFPPGRDGVVVTVGDAAADHHQQHLRQRQRPPPGLARVLDASEMLQQSRQPRLPADLQTVQTHRSSSKAETPGSGNHDKRNMYMPVY